MYVIKCATQLGAFAMKTITTQQITEAVRQLCMDVSYDLPQDVEAALEQGLAKEESSFGKYCLEQIIHNCHLAREHRQAMCQDTGIAVVYLYIGQDVHIIGGSLADAVNEGVRQGYEDGYLRKSVVEEPLFERMNTGDNTPAVMHMELVPGDQLRIMVVPKGAGSENMGAMKMLKPADGLEGAKQFILDTVRNAGGNPCPPIVVGIGVGGTMEKAPMLAKQALTREIGSRNPNPLYAKLEEELLEAINNMGIGPQGLGGRVTALAVHIEYYPTHIAMLPVAVNINCHAARHKEVVL
jgi:fumarate hydratase subunit alpha